MKKGLLIVAAFSVLAWAAPSFAFVDGEVFGGYSFGGSYESPSAISGIKENVKVKGWDYGARVHATDSILFFDFGVGGFFQQHPLEYSSNSSYKVVNSTFGFDGYARFNLIPVVKPYARVGLSFIGYNETKGGDTKKSDWKAFNSYYTGAGLAFSLPVPVVDIMIFAEYLYNHQIYSGKLTGNTINAGVSVGI